MIRSTGWRQEGDCDFAGMFKVGKSDQQCEFIKLQIHVEDNSPFPQIHVLVPFH